MAGPSLDRRSLFAAAAAALPAAAVGRARAQTEPEALQPAPQSGGGGQTWLFLNAAEVRALEALVDQLIPADDLGPGGKDAGVVVFMDRQLAGAWGAGLQLYTKGPIQQGTKQQGYQLGMTPAELYREALARLDAAAMKQGGGVFADAAPEAQLAMMRAMESGGLDLSPVPAAVFFNDLTQFAFEGFFSDPMYGGNKDMAGWKLVGFPGAYASYFEEIERHGLAWTRPPVSIAQHAELEAAMEQAMRDMPPGAPK